MGRTCGCVDGRHRLSSGLVVIPSTCAQDTPSESRTGGGENVSVVLNAQVTQVQPEAQPNVQPQVPAQVPQALHGRFERQCRKSPRAIKSNPRYRNSKKSPRAIKSNPRYRNSKKSPRAKSPTIKSTPQYTNSPKKRQSTRKYLCQSTGSPQKYLCQSTGSPPKVPVGNNHAQVTKVPKVQQKSMDTANAQVFEWGAPVESAGAEWGVDSTANSTSIGPAHTGHTSQSIGGRETKMSR
jgi:hypothetical protein